MKVQDTSKQVYFTEIKPTLNDRQKRVYDGLNGYNGLTNTELARLMGWPINSITPRIFELRQLGLVEQVEKRKCRATGRTAIAWGVKRTINVDFF